MPPLDKNLVADILEEIADLLEVRGENAFKCRAYANAARALRTLPEDLEVVVREKRLREIKGIGAGLAAAIETLHASGSLPLHEELRAAIPPSAHELLKVPGLGRAKARFLAETLKIASIEELEAACVENRLVELKGFGPKTQDRILAGIAAVRRYRGRLLLGEALPLAEHLVRLLRQSPDVTRAEVAGSVRRRSETVGNLNLVAAGPRPDRIAAAFAALPIVRGVETAPDGRTIATLERDTRVELVAAPEIEFGAALLRFTGSPAHLDRLRGRAAGAGLVLDEAGLRRGGTRLPVPDEESIYAALGLPWVPPELREGEGEVDAAAAGTLPRLVEERDIRGIFHVHSTWSDGRLLIDTLVRRSLELGYDYVGISDHSRSAFYARGLSLESLRRQQEEIDEARRRYPAIRVLKGSEVDILPDGTLDYPDEVLGALDFVVASVHSQFRLPRAEQTRRVVRALRNPHVTILGHPTGRLLLARDPYDIDLDQVFRAAAEEGVYVELNAHPHRLDLDAAACRRARAAGARIAVDPDAHDDAGLSDVRFGVGIARRAWLTAADLLNTAPVERLDEALKRR